MQKLFSQDYTISFLSNIGIVGMGLVTSVILSRGLGPIGRGEIAAVLLWPALLSYLANFGIVDATLYFASRPGVSLKAIHSSVVAMALIQSFIIIPVCLFLMPTLLASQRVEVIHYSRVYLLVIPVTIVAQATSNILRSQMHIKTTNLLGLVIPAGYLLCVVSFFITGNLSLQSIVLCQLLLSILSMLLTHVALLIHHIPVGVDVHYSVMRQLWGYGVKVHLGTIFSAANLRLDQTLLATWASPEQLGLYVVAVNVSNFLLLLPRAVSNVLTPSISRLTDITEQQRKFSGVFQRFWLVSIGSAVAMALLMFPALTLVYGDEFVGAVLPAQILVIAATLWALKIVLSGGAQALNDPLLPSRAEFVASLFTIVSLAIFLPEYGIIAAALISVLAYCIALAIMILGFRQRHSLTFTDLFRLDKATHYFLDKFRLTMVHLQSEDHRS